MCGITGYVSAVGNQPDPEVVGRMVDTLARRGPDDRGTYFRENVALGHRRLSIIDLSQDAAQPMSSPDGKITVVFNGEIYNFQTLRQELSAKGYKFRTVSDTEVLLACYREYKQACVNRLRGMFAFAIHDVAEDSLFIARDRVGKKPLYYTRTNQEFVFGSEIKAIRASGVPGRELDPVSVRSFLTYGYATENRSIYRDIRSLPPGTHMIIDTRHPGVAEAHHRYWSFEYAVDPIPSEEEWLGEMDAVLTTAVKLRMVSDAPLGAFLSGGIDSGLVAALMKKADQGPVKTFTIGFEQRRFDESERASKVADHLGTDHHVEYLTPSAIRVLPDLLTAYDEPFGDASAIATLMLCRNVSKDVTVALSGDGGDELFLGYRRYFKTARLAGMRSRLGDSGRRIAGCLAAVLPSGVAGQRTIDRMVQHPDQQYEHALGWSRNTLSLLHQNLRENLIESLSRATHLPRQCSFESRLESYQLNDMENYLPDDILVKVDRASMHYSLEVRCPLLDQEFIELSARIPTALKVVNDKEKYLLRRLASKYLPASILDVPKHGFSVPLNLWFKGELRPLLEEMVADGSSTMWQYFDLAQTRRIVSGQARRSVDSSVALWRLLLFHRWFMVNST